MHDKAQKIGVVLFVLWGLLHIIGGATMVITDGAEVLRLLGTAIADAQLPHAVDPATAGVLKFHGYNLLWMGVLVTVLAIGTWRQPDHLKFWINMAVVGAADIGLIVFLLAPGVMSLSDGLAGPLLWIGAAAFGYAGHHFRPASSTQTLA